MVIPFGGTRSKTSKISVHVPAFGLNGTSIPDSQYTFPYDRERLVNSMKGSYRCASLEKFSDPNSSRVYDTSRDILEVRIGECYGVYHRGLLSAKNSSGKDWNQIFGKEFLKCQFQKEKALEKKNPEYPTEKILNLIGSGLENDFDRFSALFSSLFK